MLKPVRECVEAWDKITSEPDWFEKARDDRKLFDAVVEAVSRTQTAIVVLKGGVDGDKGHYDRGCGLGEILDKLFGGD